MIDALFGCATESHVPEHESPPAATHGFALSFLHGRQLPPLTLAILNEGLKAHRGSEFFQILHVAEGLGEGDELHHIAAQIGRGRCDQF